MNAEELIRDVQKASQEYLEMAQDPWEFISWVLANKLAEKTHREAHLERIINANQCTNK
jgi:hypothetical protein